ncbi:hypothetical protein AB0J38_00910 [Streptomyces sp. NPDC050095]
MVTIQRRPDLDRILTDARRWAAGEPVPTVPLDEALQCLGE